MIVSKEVQASLDKSWYQLQKFMRIHHPGSNQKDLDEMCADTIKGLVLDCVYGSDRDNH